MIENYVIALESLYILDEPAEYTATYEELLEQASALESFADDLEGDLLVAALEAVDSDDSSADEASAISAKYRSGFEKIKKGKRTKNQKLVSDGQREVNEASNELKEAEKNADTAEKKAKLRKVAKIAIAVGGAVLLALLAYVGIKNRSKIVDVIRKLKKNPGSNVAQTVSEVKNAASTAAATPVEEKPVAPVSDVEKDLKELTDVKQQVGKSISDRHEAAQKEIDAALKEIYSEPTPSKDSRRPSKKMIENDKKLDELLSDSDTKSTPAASIKPKEKTGRQITADKIRADRAHKKEMKDWAIFHREYPNVSHEEYDKMREDASSMGTHYAEEKRLMSEFKKSKEEHPDNPNYSLRNMANREHIRGNKKRSDIAKIHSARNPLFSYRDKTTHGNFSGTYSPERYHGADDERKYDVMLNDIYQKYSIFDTSKGNEKRHKLIFRTLKSDVEKFKGLDKDKISRMSDNELETKVSTLARINKLIREYKESNKFGAKEELKWYNDDLDRPVLLMFNELNRRSSLRKNINH